MNNLIVSANIPMANLNKNPHRDFKMATIREETVQSLMGSVEKTDFWNNCDTRIKDNTLADGSVITEQAQIQALFDAGHDWSGEQFELAFGHHRLEALKRLDWESVVLPVRYITDEMMLHMMAEENKSGYGGNTGVICETVHKTTLVINETLQKYETFADYKKENKLFSTKKAFENAKADGVGFRKVKEFLGETWSESDVRGAFKTLKMVAKGYFTQENSRRNFRIHV